MRSQLFGFVVESKMVSELLISCPMEQAVALMKQTLVEHGALISSQPATRSKLIHYIDDPLTISLEAYLNEWEDQLVEILHRLTSIHCHKNELLRMMELKRALALVCPQFREMTVLGQFDFWTVLDNTTLFRVTLGWNEDANLLDIAQAEEFFSHYKQKLEKMGVKYLTAASFHQEEKAKAKPKQSKPRRETRIKLDELDQYRSQHIYPQYVGLDKRQACDDKNIALKTVKKYAPTLYKRWYDVDYKGGVR